MELAAIGTPVLHPDITVVCDRILKNQRFFSRFQGKKELLLDRLDSTLKFINVVLVYAEDMHVRTPTLRKWFTELISTVYHAGDILDEINTQRLRIVSNCSEFELRDPKFSAPKVSGKFIKKLMVRLEKVCDTLESYASQVGGLGLTSTDNLKCSYRRPSSSLVIESQIVGRDDEKEKLIQMLLSNGGDECLSLISINGMGGVGKTTLAQLLYNDERVKNHFEKKAWVHVSEKYDPFSVTKSLLREIDPDLSNRNDTYNSAQVKLRDSLRGKRFIIVLDDVWNDNYNDWDTLMIPLRFSGLGSKIIVTSRLQEVGFIIDNRYFHHVDPIPNDQSWNLFKLHNCDIGDLSSNDEFEKIGREIVKKCKGLPLAIKVVAGALRWKTDICEWRKLLSRKIWMAGGDLLPRLCLSYKLLPSHLRSCFSFCAIFPKGIPFDKEQVVLMWMANDIVPDPQRGKFYFEDLWERSLFERVDDDKYMMHDMVHDVASYVSSNFSVILEEVESKSIYRVLQSENALPPEMLHLSYVQGVDRYERFRGLSQIQSLRTFLPHQSPDNGITYPITQDFITRLFFPDGTARFRHIRTLSFSGYNILEIPESIGDMSQLRFFNLANTLIRSLPKAITKCVNLQTIILAYCTNLLELPEGMERLINLQHLDLTDVPIVDSIVRWLSNVKDTQNLSVVPNEVHATVLSRASSLPNTQPASSNQHKGLIGLIGRVCTCGRK